MMDDLWWVSLAECRQKLFKEYNSGYGTYFRKKGFKGWNGKTYKRHKQSYYFWFELYCYKLLTDQGYHIPIYIIEPRWEQEIMYEFWRIYFSYGWQGAKTDRKPNYID